MVATAMLEQRAQPLFCEQVRAKTLTAQRARRLRNLRLREMTWLVLEGEYDVYLTCPLTLIPERVLRTRVRDDDEERVTLGLTRLEFRGELSREIGVLLAQLDAEYYGDAPDVEHCDAYLIESDCPAVTEIGLDAQLARGLWIAPEIGECMRMPACQTLGIKAEERG